MDDRRFDHLARALARASTRRAALAALAGMASGLGLVGREVGARKRRRQCVPACAAGQTCTRGTCTCDDGGTACGASCCTGPEVCADGACTPPPPQCIPAGEPCKGVGRRCCDGRACASGQGGQDDIACWMPAGGACATTADCVWFAECAGGICIDVQPRPPQWTPLQLRSSLLLWLDASNFASLRQRSGPVATWHDISGRQRDFSQATAAERPTAQPDARAGKAVVRFDGAAANVVGVFAWGTSLASADTGLAAPPYCYALAFQGSREGRWTRVFQGFAGEGNFGYWHVYHIAAGDIAQGGSPDGQWHVAVLRFDASSMGIYIDGTLVTQDAPPATTAPQEHFTIGRTADDVDLWSADPLTGDVGEVFVMNQAPDVAERQLIEGYLSHKWGLAGNLPNDHPWKAAAPTVP